MKTNNLQKQTVRIDATTKALLDEAWAAAQRGETFTEEEVEAELDKIEIEWQESQAALPA